MGVTQAAGLSLKWFRDNLAEKYKDEASLKGVDSYDLINQDVAGVPIDSRRLIYLPYLMGERTPHLNPDCRGVFFGLSAIHTKADMLRAVMEGVSYSLLDCLDVLREMHVDVSEMMACGGGGKSRIWRQMLADMYGCEVKTIKAQEGPALGVAILAGVGAAIYQPGMESEQQCAGMGSQLHDGWRCDWRDCGFVSCQKDWPQEESDDWCGLVHCWFAGVRHGG